MCNETNLLKDKLFFIMLTKKYRSYKTLETQKCKFQIIQDGTIMYKV